MAPAYHDRCDFALGADDCGRLEGGLSAGRIVAATVHLLVWSDYLCPWCHLAAARVRRIEEQFAEQVTIEWRSFLLRPHPDPNRTLEQFRRYTQSWLRAAAEPDAPPFRPWASDEGPPSHSVPPHLVAKAAATLGPDAFRSMHGRLLEAYFTESRDITSTATLLALWREVGLPEEAFARAGDEAILTNVIAQHDEAVGYGINGVPAVLMAGNDVPIVGAMPYETYRRWVDRRLAGEIPG
jgi:predicted DsbA family dithiol-disulfide isomerase